MKKTIILAFIFLLVGLTGLVMFCGQKKQLPAPKKTPVVLAPVVKQEISRPLHAYGHLASQKEAKLSFKTGGIIKKIWLAEGQPARAGQLLASLDLVEIESGVKQARSGFDKARRDLERVKNLYQDRVATLEQYQDVETAFQVAQSQLKAAEFNLRFSEIRAPENGRILKRLVEENELVGPGMPIFFFGSATENQAWLVRAGVSDRDWVRLRPGDTASVSFDPYPGATFAGRISQIAEAPDPMAGTYEIELTLEPTDRKLVTGLVARVDIFPGDKHPYFVIPVEALVGAEGEEGRVFVVDQKSGTARQVTVRFGFLFDDKVAVLSGLEGIDQVVATGAPYLVDGSLIQVVPAGRWPAEKPKPAREGQP